MKVADIDPAFEKAFNAGDLDALLRLYDDQSVLVAEPGKPVQGLAAIKQALIGFLD
jgi:ketosteroid isomerase-like protein